MISEMVLVALTIFNVLILCLTFLMYINTLNTKYQITQIHSAISTIVTKLFGMEHVLGKMVTAFTEFTEMSNELFDQIAINFGGNQSTGVYRTMDGKYTSNSLEGLIEKIRKDGKEKDYLTDDMDQLRKLFESEDDIFDDDDE